MNPQVDDKNYINIFHIAIFPKNHIKVIYLILISNLPDRNKARKERILILKKTKQKHYFIHSYSILMDIETLIQV